MRSISDGVTGLRPRSEEGVGCEYTALGHVMRDDTTIGRDYQGIEQVGA